MAAKNKKARVVRAAAGPQKVIGRSYASAPTFALGIEFETHVHLHTELYSGRVCCLKGDR